MSDLCGGPNPDINGSSRTWSRARTLCLNTNFTKQQLDMRRKAEILQYKNNTHTLTKKQHYAKIAKGGGPHKKKQWASQNQYKSDPNAHGLTRNGNSIICEDTGKQCISSRASDVPGPSIILCYDKTVPYVR